MLTFPVGSFWEQLKNHFWNELPWGTYSWYWQEKGKGACQQDWLLGSSHGGWKFNTYWVNYWGATLSPAVMNDTLPAILQDQPMFSVTSTANKSLWDLDFELLSPGGSTYAQANRNRILADAIPAMSVVAGANPIAILTQPGQPHNIDMMSLKNGWSSGRTGVESGMWHHSDFVQMAYTFTYQLFDKLVTTGNIK